MLVTLLKDKKNRPVNHKQKVQLIRVIFDFVLVNKKTIDQLAPTSARHSLQHFCKLTEYTVLQANCRPLFLILFSILLKNERRVVVICHIEQERQQLL